MGPLIITTMSVLQNDSPYRTLTIVFVAWKVLVLAVAAGSQVGPTYDTSSGLLTLSPHGGDDSTRVRNLTARLVSWDAIYFVKAAQRGYLFEQEWAFGSALPTCISFLVGGRSISRCWLHFSVPFLRSLGLSTNWLTRPSLEKSGNPRYCE